MTEAMKPVVRRCIVEDCDRQVVGMACDDPEHQEIAAEMMHPNAGIPVEAGATLTEDDFCEVFDWVMDHSSMATNHLPESPLGMDVDVRQCHK